MKLLVVSDTHRHIENLEKVYEKVRPVDAVLHLGDMEGQEDLIRAMVECPVYFVKGNCDRGSDEPDEQLITLGGVRIFMAHGHRHGIGWGTEGLEEAGFKNEAQIVLFGHTHRPLLEWRGGFWLANPGSLTLPRQEDHRPSFMTIEIDRNRQILPGICYLD